MCNDPPPRGRARLHLAVLEDPKNIPTDQIRTLSSRMRTPEGLLGRSPTAPGQARLTLEFFSRWAFRKEVATCWYEYPYQSY
jgi:hypothetical protein